MTEPTPDQNPDRPPSLYSGGPDHIWHTAAPRTTGAPRTSNRILALVFLLVVVVLVVGALFLIGTGSVSTDSPTPGR